MYLPLIKYEVSLNHFPGMMSKLVWAGYRS